MAAVRDWLHGNRYWLMACAAAAGAGVAFGLLLAIRAGRADSEEVSSGSHGKGSVVLEPGERSYVVLSATRGAVEAMVEYLHQIDGRVFYHFGKRIDGHYLWYAPFSQLYSRGELSRTRRELLSIDVYSDWDIGLEPGEVKR